MALDSKASFASRLDDLGLTDLAGQFDSLGWDTFGALAYATGTPGAPSSDSVLDERLIIPVLVSVTNRLAAQVRRLYFESVTIAAAELRRRVDRPADPLTATPARGAGSPARSFAGEAYGDLNLRRFGARPVIDGRGLPHI